MATIYDVAKLAQVSTKTVSRVLNEEPLVAEETKRKVLTAINQLDYHPNAIAASLKRRHSNIIGFVVPYGSEFVFQDMNMMEQLRGAHEAVTQEGYDLLISVPANRKDALGELLRLVRHKNVDGVILYPTAGVEQIIKELTAKNFKYVTLDLYREDQKINYVNINITAAAKQGTKHLISLGHRQIGLINKPNSFFNCYLEDALAAGYRVALTEQGLEYAPEMVVEGDFTVEGGYRAFNQLWRVNEKMSALICASDPMTYGAIRAAEEHGLKVGYDIEIIAGDDLPLTRKLYPFLSAISNPSYEQGRCAGKMIISLLDEKQDLPGVTLNAEFLMRSR